MKIVSAAVVAGLLAGSVWAHADVGRGYLYASRDDNWQGRYEVDAGAALLTGQAALVLGGVVRALVPTVTTGCAVSSSCTPTLDGGTMTYRSLHINGYADLGDGGRLEWRAQGARLLPGMPSPAIVTFGSLRGVLGGMVYDASSEDWVWNAQFTTRMRAEGESQVLDSLRVDFWHDVASTPLSLAAPSAVAAAVPVSVPEPATAALLLLGLVVVGAAGALRR